MIGRHAKRRREAAEPVADEAPAEMAGRGAEGRARLRELARAAAILGCPAAEQQPATARYLTCFTRLPREAAIALLQKTERHGATAGLLAIAECAQQAEWSLVDDGQPVRLRSPIPAAVH